jgi:sec-independent protein translocase protein TatC
MKEEWVSFWEHVEDLRHTILRSLIVVGVGFLTILGFYEPILQFLTAFPFEQAKSGILQQKVQRTSIKNVTTSEQLFELPPHTWLLTDPPSSSQKDGHRYYHIAPGGFLLYEQTIEAPLLIMGPIEGLVLVFKVCFWLSVALTAPLWGWIWLQFILPGLKANERSILLPFLLFSLISISMGLTLAYFVTLPLANQYLTLFNLPIGQNAWTLTHYVNYVLLLCLGHAVAAELSLLLFLLVHFRYLSPDWLVEKRRYMIVAAFILGALLTPPDVLTQLLLAFPLMGLYELAIWYAKWRKNLIVNIIE